jgi:hypothetical protein
MGKMADTVVKNQREDEIKFERQLLREEQAREQRAFQEEEKRKNMVFERNKRLKQELMNQL